MLSEILLASYYILRSAGLLFVPKGWRAKKILDDDVILITGAGSGLGRQFALSFVNRGAQKVVLIDINEAGMKETGELIKQQSHSCQVHTYALDVTKRNLVYATADKVKTEVGIGPTLSTTPASSLVHRSSRRRTRRSLRLLKSMRSLTSGYESGAIHQFAEGDCLSAG